MNAIVQKSKHEKLMLQIHLSKYIKEVHNYSGRDKFYWAHMWYLSQQSSKLKNN